MKKKRDINRTADRFYDYLMARRGQILRYATAALITGLIQFFFRRLVPADNYVPFVLRMLLLFPVLKLWVYRERGTDGFYTARQLMLAVMLITLVTLGILYLEILLVGLFARIVLFHYICQFILEIAYFVLFQFIIFKEPKNS